MLRKKIIVDVIAPVVCMCWAAMMIYGAIFSPDGFRAQDALLESYEQKRQEVEALRSHREAMEKTADLLSSRSLDPDIVDEKVRSILGFTSEGDIILPRSEVRRLIKSSVGSTP